MNAKQLRAGVRSLNAWAKDAPPIGDGFTPSPCSAIPTQPGFYWFTGDCLHKGNWTLVRVFRPLWIDPSRQDLEWSYMDGSGSYPLTGGEWSPQVLPPDMPNKCSGVSAFTPHFRMGQKAWVPRYRDGQPDEPMEATVGEIKIEISKEGVKEEYMCDETGIGTGTLYTLGESIFDTEEECQASCIADFIPPKK